ncbi:MAG: hypothetical protein ACE5MI_14735 [Acidimicrobiia bacterium]
MRTCLHPLPGDPRDVVREPLVDLRRELSPGHAQSLVVVVQPLGQLVSLPRAGIHGHRRQVAEIRAEDFAKVDPLHVSATQPVLECAPQIDARRTGGEDPSRQGSTD